MITTKALLKFFSVEEISLLKNFDTLDNAEKGEISGALWEAFDMYYETLLQKNITELRNSIAEGKIPANKNFYKTVIQKTRQDIMHQILTTGEKADLETARKAMEFIVKEISAAKADRKTATKLL